MTDDDRDLIRLTAALKRCEPAPDPAAREAAMARALAEFDRVNAQRKGGAPAGGLLGLWNSLTAPAALAGVASIAALGLGVVLVGQNTLAPPQVAAPPQAEMTQAAPPPAPEASYPTANATQLSEERAAEPPVAEEAAPLQDTATLAAPAGGQDAAAPTAFGAAPAPEPVTPAPQAALVPQARDRLVAPKAEAEADVTTAGLFGDSPTDLDTVLDALAEGLPDIGAGALRAASTPAPWDESALVVVVARPKAALPAALLTDGGGSHTAMLTSSDDALDRAVAVFVVPRAALTLRTAPTAPALAVTSADMPMAASLAGAEMLARGDGSLGDWGWDDALALAEQAAPSAARDLLVAALRARTPL